MKNYIVLLKQVPDIKEIDDNAFNKDTGTLIRKKKKNVINELDAQALSFAFRLRELEEEDSNNENKGQIICLSMGPGSAKEVLIYALSRGATQGVLLSDRALGGADTVATASPISEAILKIKNDYFNGNDDFYIISGMQSVDGDTAQVPAQIAAALNIPCIPFLTDLFKENNKIIFNALTINGEIKVSPIKTPCVLTVAKYEYKLYKTFKDSRIATRKETMLFDASSIPNTKFMGLNGSKTQVVRVFAPDRVKRKRIKISNVNKLCSIIKELIKKEDGTSIFTKNSDYKLINERENVFDRSYEGLEADKELYNKVYYALTKLNIKSLNDITEDIKTDIIKLSGLNEKQLSEVISSYNVDKNKYSGDVFCVAELRDGEVAEGTLQILGKVNKLSRDLKVNACVILIGNDVKDEAKKLISYGADIVYVVDDKKLNVFDPLIYKDIVCKLLTKYKPQIVLYSATYFGRVLAPLVSYNLDCGLTADCTSLDIKDYSKKNELAILMQTRPALGGNIMATICTKNSPMQMATMREGIAKALNKDNDRSGKIINEDVNVDYSCKSFDVIKSDIKNVNKVNFSKDIILVGGRGLQNKENFKKYIIDASIKMEEKLNCNTSFGASRAAVEQGFTQRGYQIGQTGTAVSPKIYIACGISGAIQHTIGIQNSGTIISINNDPNAPIFEESDYYLVGNVSEVIDKILEEI